MTKGTIQIEPSEDEGSARKRYEKDEEDPESGDDDVDFSSTQTSEFVESDRDEVKEVQRMTLKDSKIVQKSRILALLALLATAFAVTYTSYRLLKAEETNNFETAFGQFSRTVSEAAIQQQLDLREGMEQLSTFVSAWANSDKNSEFFPFVTLPNWQQIANNVMKQAHIESVMYSPLIKNGLEDAWANYSLKNVQWLEEAHQYDYGNLDRLIHGKEAFSPYITRSDGEGGLAVDTTQSTKVPLWLHAPPPISYAWLNANLMGNPELATTVNTLVALRNETIVQKNGPLLAIPLAFSEEEHAKYHSKLEDSSVMNPHGFAFHPVHAIAGDKGSDVTGIIVATSAWDAALLGLLPEGVEGIDVIVRNNCNQSYSYTLVGGEAYYQGEGNIREEKYSDMEVVVNLTPHTNPNFNKYPGHCSYTMHIFPSSEFQSNYNTGAPEIFAAVVASTFVFVAVAFFGYDWSQTSRNTNLIHKAAQSNAIVSNLFPDQMRERLMAQQAENQQAKAAKGSGNLKTYLNNGTKEVGPGGFYEHQSKPLADLFLDTTVVIADICGFTAWSSVREPFQVFTLLEAIFQKMDRIAKKRRVTKVETVGDKYVAVCGLPEPRKDHAVVVARFARDILASMHILTKELEITLGPDTADLGLRIGIHSGAVTAGILRGDRARFQLFGDTVNTCQRIEQSGLASYIHCSEQTAQLIREAGKEAWLSKRSESVALKNKGRMATYWVKVQGERQGSVCSGSSFPYENDALVSSYVKSVSLPGLDEKTYRLIDWNVEMLLQILKRVVAHRLSTRKSCSSGRNPSICVKPGETPLEEVREIIALPGVQRKVRKSDPEKVEIPKEVASQLHYWVSTIATMYNKNPFHNFEHASHVLSSVIKLMSRIVAPPDLDDVSSDRQNELYDDHCYGITADPMIQLACAVSAIIHDVDHEGVSNAQLVKEGVPLATKYKERSVAEQHSLDVSWDLLMQPKYDTLRDFLFPNRADLTRFRQLVVNSVMATDIVDKDMKDLRNRRWDKAFKKGDSSGWVDENPQDEINRKATIVIEHIIQASDIAHTMQHWQIYLKWNRNLFEELYVAYLNGRMEKNPADFWYKGEFGFFDFYIIPLTRKLKECGVFGVSSGEYLQYALKNRQEWEDKGEEVVAGMIQACHEKYGTKEDATSASTLPGEVDC